MCRKIVISSYSKNSVFGTEKNLYVTIVRNGKL